MVKHLDFVRIIENDKWTRHEPESQSGILVLAFPNLSRAVPENQYLLLCFFSAVSTLKERTAQSCYHCSGYIVEFWSQQWCILQFWDARFFLNTSGSTLNHLQILMMWKCWHPRFPLKDIFFLGIEICNWSHTHIDTNSGESLYKQQCVVHKQLQPVRTSIVKTRLERRRTKYTSKIHFRN